MGNVLLDEYKKGDPIENFEKWLQENSELSGKEVLAENKLFLTAQFTYSSKSVILKVYFKRDNTNISDYLNSFAIIAEEISKHKCVNLIPLTILNSRVLQNKENNLIMATRQFLSLTLEEKLLRRPSLSLQEKKWVIFQMILAVDAVHFKLNLYHGNLRTSNFLMTSYEYLFLTDFANYKPTYILEDTNEGLTEFRLFYHSSLEKCSLAPQKLQGQSESVSKIKTPEYLFNLYKNNEVDERASNRHSVAPHDEKSHKSKKSLDQESISYISHINNLKQMDLFSLGMCIVEVLNDGKSVFTYENLLSLKKNNFNLKEMVETTVKNSGCGEEIKKILEDLLIDRRDNSNPLFKKHSTFMDNQVFILLWHCLSCFTKVSFQLTDHRIYLFHNIIEFIEKQIKYSNTTFTMKKAKCLENFGALKIMVELIKKKLINTIDIEPNSILGKIVNFIEKKETDPKVVESENESEEQQDQRQSYFINPSKKKMIEKRMSFIRNPFHEKKLCPPAYDELLSALFEPTLSDSKFSRLSIEERRKNKLQKYLHTVKQEQHIREEIKSSKRYFYSDFQIVIKIIFSCVRNCRYVASKMLAMQLINIMAKESKDGILLKTVMPYFISLCQDTDISVARYAVNSLVDLFYNFVDPFETEEDAAYYQLFLEFLLNMIKSSKVRIFMFGRFKEIYDICEWLEVAFLKLTKDKASAKKLGFYKLVDQLKIYYGTLSSKQILVLMENIPISILPEMFEFYISFLNTEKIMGLKCSLFIAQNAAKQFQSQKDIIQVFDSCMETGLTDVGVALYYSIIYFTIRKDTHLDIVHKIAPHIINPNLWVRGEALKYIEMCLEQFPPTKIFFLFRQIFEPPFPLRPEDLSESVLLPQPLKQSEVSIKNRKYADGMKRKVGLTQKRFLEYLVQRKSHKDSGSSKKAEQLENWMSETKGFRQIKDKIEGENFSMYMKKTVEQLYENNFFYYGLLMENKHSNTDRDKGLERLFDNLKRLSKFNIEENFVAQEQKQFFESLFANINSSFENLLTKKKVGLLVPEKLRLSLCINSIGEQLYTFQQFQVKPSMNLGAASVSNQNERNFRPKGIQICEIYENKDTIANIVKVGDNFFISGCHDGTVRIYSTKSIEMNIVMESEATFEVRVDSGSEEKVKINALQCIENTFTAVVGTNRGQLKGYQLQRMHGKMDSSRHIKTDSQNELFKYKVQGQIEQITIPKVSYFNETIAYVTTESVLGIQDIRCKQNSMLCNIGKERGFCLSMESNNQSSIFVGTIDGYLLTYDIRFNVISSVLQLNKDNQSLPITKITKVPWSENTLCLSYPYTNFEFAEFNINSSEIRIEPTKLYHGGSNNPNKEDQNIPSIPYLENKTNDEVFGLCNNNIQKHMYYKNLSNFDTNYKILDYVSEPLTLKESKIREVWANGCRHRYNQILSIYNKKSVPFVEYLNTGILTNFNPTADKANQKYSNIFDSHKTVKDLSFLVERKDKDYVRETFEIDRDVISKHNKIKICHFDDEFNKEYYTSCAIVNNYAALVTKSNKIKIFK